MDKTRLVEAAKALNGITYENEEKEARVQLIKNKIKTTAISEEVLIQSFKTALQELPEDLEQYLPDLVSDTFNELQDNEWKLEKESTPTVAQGETKEAEKTVAKEPCGKNSAYGTKIVLLKELISKGCMTRKAITDEVQAKFPESSKASTVSFISHTMSSKGKSPLGVKVVVNADGFLGLEQK